MNKFLTAAAFALALVPAVANAASTSFDPGANNASPTFVTAPAEVNPANAAAAAADAQRYATVADSAVVGTHGVSPLTVVEYDPGSADGQSAFVTKVVLSGASASTAHQSFVPYAANSEVIGN
ncbi:hypothetical protein [Pleomorphomonas sp. PLEO]|uniref:hypothetical protein n=1 Tax=Pleomorphomonas sp. PLEO TaxID=3239306 RepID=UPI00351DDB86